MATQTPQETTPKNWRQPSGKVAHPFILVEGEEKAGKSYRIAQLSGSDKIGHTFWIDLNDDTADEYGAIEGADYIVADHDGTYQQVLARMEEARTLARQANANGDLPCMLVIDTWSAVWNGLKDWVTERAMNSRSGQAQRRQDPEAEVKPTRNQWNDARSRYNRMMNVLKTFPGIVVITARGKEVSATDPSTGQPYKDGRRTWSVEGETNLGYDVFHWIRFTRDNAPLVVGSRNVRPGLSLVPGKDDPISLTEKIMGKGVTNDLEWFIFAHLGYNSQQAHDSVPNRFVGGELTDDERVAAERDGEIPEPTVKGQRQSQQQGPGDVVGVIDRAGEKARQDRSVDPLNTVRQWLDKQGLINTVHDTPQGRMSFGQYVDGWATHLGLVPQADPTPGPETPAEVAADDYQEAALWMDELTGMATDVVGTTVQDLMGVRDDSDMSGAPAAALKAKVLELRPRVIQRMRDDGQVDEAEAYEQATTLDAGPARWADLIAVREAANA